MNGVLYLIARIAGRTVAFPADEVESVVELGAITPAPCASPGVLGLAALRSRVATVIDPRVALGLDATGSAGTHAVVGLADGHLYAAVVEELEDVAAYAAAPLPPGQALTARWTRGAAAVIDRDGEPVLVLALSTLVPPASARAA